MPILSAGVWGGNTQKVVQDFAVPLSVEIILCVTCDRHGSLRGVCVCAPVLLLLFNLVQTTHIAEVKKKHDIQKPV